MKILRKTKVFAYLFYILAILFGIYTIFQIVSTIGYLSSVVNSGMYTDVGVADMISAFLSAVGPYFFYALVFFFCGYIIQLVTGEIIPIDQEIERTSDYPDYEKEISEAESKSTETNNIEDNTGYSFEAGEDTSPEEDDSVESVVSTLGGYESEPENDLLSDVVVGFEVYEPESIETDSSVEAELDEDEAVPNQSKEVEEIEHNIAEAISEAEEIEEIEPENDDEE